ncbi:MAG: N-acetyl-gamma-glutamyl-phosphate reductase [Epsilonproteobacteria bacterium]|nr:N-acetyl-gamma-glutamyl-phosphate reductase [Campylobacterota bacterium]NPA57614.1 N-acetyl-gamma-glutamyl-phosphate reductase [Campylobacterota bacterium]
MRRASIVGASGFTGLELIKLLLNHGKMEIVGLYGSEEGAIEKLYPGLVGVFEMEIEKVDLEKIARTSDIVFLALPHKSAMEVARPLLEQGVMVVDLSADYRLKRENYEAFYTRHTDPENLKKAIYGIPEIWRTEIEKAQLVANPGCYPTAALLAAIPFLPYIDFSERIVIDAKSGVSGAGKKCGPKSHFVTIDENIFAYNPLKHRHAIEIKEKLELLGREPLHIDFVPHLIPIDRGMLVSLYLTLREPVDPLQLLREFYGEEPFIRIKGEPVDVKSVAGTHFCDIYGQCEGRRLFLTSAIDNLLRGASSQAVANANLMLGLEEYLGLPKIPYIP